MAKKETKKTEKTSKTVASKAAKILKDPTASKDVKSVAASALTQTADRDAEKANAGSDVQKHKLLVGVNFRADGDKKETRIEAGEIIEAGTLPTGFENRLREKGQLVDVR